MALAEYNGMMVVNLREKCSKVDLKKGPTLLHQVVTLTEALN